MKFGNPEENATIDCPRCRRPNPVDLIYCADPDCIAVLHPGRTTCGWCRADIPVNARFCPECGHLQILATCVSDWQGDDASDKSNSAPHSSTSVRCRA